MRERATRDAAILLIRALRARAGADAVVATASHVPWMSATFAGMRHEIALVMPQADVAGFCDGIGEADLVVRGHLVADIVATPGAGGVRIEALTVSETA